MTEIHKHSLSVAFCPLLVALFQTACDPSNLHQPPPAYELERSLFGALFGLRVRFPEVKDGEFVGEKGRGKFLGREPAHAPP